MEDPTGNLALRRRSRRLAWLVTVLSLALLLLAVRLFFLQVVHGAALSARAVAQRTDALPLALGRGLILDRNLRPLHAPLVSWRLVAFTPYLDDPLRAAAQITRLTGVDADQVYDALRSADGFVVVAAPLGSAQAGAVARAGADDLPPGVSVVQYEERYGPGAVAPHVVGYVRVADDVGVAGLEKAFDRELRGREAVTLLAVYDAYRRPMDGFRVVQSGEPAGGHDIVTTLDWNLQQRVEQVLVRHGRAAAVVVVDARTGDILAMASHPRFNAGRLEDYLDRTEDRPLVNRALSAYPPGSVFKVVTAAAALERGILTPDRLFACRGYIDVGDHRFPSHCPPGAGPLITWEQAMAASSNEVFIQTALELGADALLEAAAEFGFGQATGLPLPEDRAGHLPAAAEVRFAGDLANLAIGQGPLTVTPVQVAQFLTALVNDGRLQPVDLVREVRRGDGVLVREYPRPEARQVMSPATAAALRRALRAVVREGTGTLAEVPIFGAAGKTGTAETGRSLPGGGDLAHAWFAGYVPATLPRYIVVVLVEGGQSGPLVAAPLFGEVAQSLLGHPRGNSRIP
ncbi:MAG TPA: penicillin-binding transpeptidase domain-containing protein [Bacillota bacterium]